MSEEKGILKKGLQIGEAWMNLARNKNSELYQARLNVCKLCPVYNETLGICNPVKSVLSEETGKYINGCGCSIAAKARLLTATCPANKWKEVDRPFMIIWGVNMCFLNEYKRLGPVKYGEAYNCRVIYVHELEQLLNEDREILTIK